MKYTFLLISLLIANMVYGRADSIMQNDSTVANANYDSGLAGWYGSAALPLYLPYSDKIWKLKP